MPAKRGRGPSTFGQAFPSWISGSVAGVEIIATLRVDGEYIDSVRVNGEYIDVVRLEGEYIDVVRIEGEVDG